VIQTETFENIQVLKEVINSSLLEYKSLQYPFSKHCLKGREWSREAWRKEPCQNVARHMHKLGSETKEEMR